MPPTRGFGDPALFEVYPAKANVGDTVTITGINFGASSTGDTLSWLYNPAFNIPAADITSWTATLWLLRWEGVMALAVTPPAACRLIIGAGYQPPRRG
jgi:hypothetical protein